MIFFLISFLLVLNYCIAVDVEVDHISQLQPIQENSVYTIVRTLKITQILDLTGPASNDFKIYC